jgi:hypothetical protein
MHRKTSLMMMAVTRVAFGGAGAQPVQSPGRDAVEALLSSMVYADLSRAQP